MCDGEVVIKYVEKGAFNNRIWYNLEMSLLSLTPTVFGIAKLNVVVDFCNLYCLNKNVNCKNQARSLFSTTTPIIDLHLFWLSYRLFYSQTNILGSTLDSSPYW